MGRKKRKSDFEPFYVKVLYGALNVRKEPSLESEIVDKLPINVIVEVVGAELGFYQIVNGWIDRRYVEAVL